LGIDRIIVPLQTDLGTFRLNMALRETETTDQTKTNKPKAIGKISSTTIR
jgi:hypothetical protein